MKTISLDHPVRVYFKDGECYHDSAAIMIANGFPSFVRGRGPDVVYPWENVKRIARVANEAQAPERITALEAEIVRLTTLHREKRLTLRAALGLSDNEDLDHAALCERVSHLWGNYQAACKTANINAEEASRLEADLASVTEQRDILKRQLEELRADLASQYPNRDKPPPGFDVSRLPKNLRMTVETAGVWGPNALSEAWRLHEEERKPALPQPKQVDLGGMSNADWPATSFAVIGAGRKPSSAFKPSDYGTGILFNPPSDAEHQQAQNRDQWRATCLANGAKDCTVFFGPGEEVTFVVEMNQCTRKTISEIKEALMVEHCLPPTAYTIREVRPGVAGAVRKASEP